MTAEVLKILYDAHGEYVSGEQIGKSLGVSRASVANHVAKLKEKGFRVESNTKRGHRLAALDDILTEETIALFTPIRAKVYGELISTFTAAAKTVGENITVALRQSQGRGRRRRAYSSEEGGIYFTYKFSPIIPPHRANLLTLAAGVAVAQTCAEYGIQALVKYPNDCYVDGKKFCGILTECTLDSDCVQSASIGIGINVNNELPAHLTETAVALSSYHGSILRAQMIAQIVDRIKTLTADADGIVAEFAKYDFLSGKNILLITDESTREGQYRGIDQDGYLLAEIQGKTERITIGEVSLRPAKETV